MQEKTDQYIKAFQQNDSEVIGELYREHRQAFLQFSKRYPLDSDLSLDIYQDAFVALRDKALSGHLDNLDCSLKTYLFGIGKFLIYKRLKKEGKKNMLLVSDQEALEDELDVVITEGMAELTDQQRTLKRHFTRLGTKCQEVLTLFYYRGLTIDEIADVADYKNSNVVKSQKSRCLKQLKSMINLKHGEH